MSEHFFRKLNNEDMEGTYKNRIIKIAIKKGSLSGFPKEKRVYYLKPSEGQINHILDENSVELVEDSKDLSVKAKLKLLRMQLKNKQQGEGGNEN